MSTLIHLGAEVLAAHQAGALPMASGDGILDWVTVKNTQTQTVLRAVAVTVGIIFVIVQAVLSRLAMARIIISLLAAGLFVWGVWSVTDIQDRVGNEFAAGPGIVQTAPGPHDAAPGPTTLTSSTR